VSLRWNWDFEEERTRRHGRAHAPDAGNDAERVAATAPAPPQPPSPQAARRAAIRRRRAAAAVFAVGILVLVAASVSSSHHGAAASGRHSSPAAAIKGRTDPKRVREDESSDAVAAVLAYTSFVRHGGTRSNEVALTFDDGPGPYTPSVLTVLERMRVHATFFTVGRMERYFGSSTVREIRDGDAIGDHTEDHAALGRLSAHDQHEQLLEQIARVEVLGGSRPALFRPPYGSFNATTLRELHTLHLLMVLWSVDTSDYLQPGVEAIVQRALAGAHPGAIILMHDAGGNRSQTIAALPAIIRGLRAKGLRPVTVPTLLRDDPPAAGEPVPRSLAGD
jgi:peptidoglycan-N-acetylglucosamine deacetylase